MRDRNGPFRGLVDTSLGQVHFRVQGTGLPLLLCHQAPSSLRQFDPVYDLLEQAGIQAIGVDAAGYGASDVPDHAPNIAEYADSLVAVLDHLGIASADILGQHTGAMIALEATLRAPARYRRLILNTPPAFAPEERAAMLAELIPRQRGWKLRPDGSHLAEMWQRRVRATGGGWSSVEGMHRNVVQMLLPGETIWYAHHAALNYDLLARLVHLEHRCLLLTNTGDTRFPLCERARRLRPDLEYRELAGGSHDIVDEMPGEWVDAVASFLHAPPPTRDDIGPSITHVPRSIDG